MPLKRMKSLLILNRMKFTKYFLPVAAFAIAGCGSDSAETATEETVIEEATAESKYNWDNDGILVYEADIATEHPNSRLSLLSSLEGAGTDSIEFEFSVEDYELGIQTVGASERNCANSDGGQHIHYIVNNAPYKAKYTSSFKEVLAPGSNTILAFISRSYHESIKSKDAYVLTQVNIGDEGESVDLENGEHLFYSRPKGNYTMKQGNRILLDFYLVNSELAEDGNRVKATINGKEFLLPKWVPYFIEGLPLGENTVQLELIDKDGNLVDGPFNNSGERTFTITEG